MVGFLTRVEGLLERAVEGSSRALFRQRLQPIELAKAAARAMQRQRLVGPEGIEVPNAFVIALHPDDAAVHLPYRASLEGRIARFLASFADERGMVPVGEVSVALVADAGVRRYGVRVDARMADAPAPPPTRPVEPTAVLPRVDRHGGEAPSPTGPAALLLEDGRLVPIGTGPLRLGRALDNDVPLADSRVSRYHVRIEYDGPDLIVRDLGSTNGTVLDGHPIVSARLPIGAVLALGGYRIQVVPANGGPDPSPRDRRR